MNLSPRHLIKLLEENGFILKRSKGSHRLYYNPINNKTAIVPFHRGRDLKRVHFWQFLDRLVSTKMKLNKRWMGIYSMSDRIVYWSIEFGCGDESVRLSPSYYNLTSFP